MVLKLLKCKCSDYVCVKLCPPPIIYKISGATVQWILFHTAFFSLYSSRPGYWSIYPSSQHTHLLWDVYKDVFAPIGWRDEAMAFGAGKTFTHTSKHRTLWRTSRPAHTHRYRGRRGGGWEKKKESVTLVYQLYEVDLSNTREDGYHLFEGVYIRVTWDCHIHAMTNVMHINDT